jgi:hypothetical protein
MDTATARANVDLDVPGLQPYVEAATATRARLCVLSGDAAPAAAVGRCRGPRTANGGARSSADPAVRSCASRTIAPRAWKPSWKRTTAGLRSSRTAFSRRTRRSWVDIRDRGTGCNAARHRWCALQAGGRRFGTGWLHCLEVPAIGLFERGTGVHGHHTQEPERYEAGTVDRSATSRREQLPAPCSGSVTFA